MTKVIIVSGFLGSGKTTLIKQMLDKRFRNKKVIVIENDFGNIEIDAKLLSECDFKVRNLHSGCICCDLKQDFEKTIRAALAEEPDYIIIEPSGIAHLSEIEESCLAFEHKGKLILSKAFTIIDIRSYKEYMSEYENILKDQILYADLILYSHTQETDKNVHDSVTSDIRKINGSIEIFDGPWDKIPSKFIIMDFRNSNTMKADIRTSISCVPTVFEKLGKNADELIHGNFIKKNFRTVELTCDGTLSAEDLKKRLRLVINAAGASIIRGKGIAHCREGYFLFQYVKDDLTLTPTPLEGNTICLIGSDMDQGALQAVMDDSE